ncbi:uncharacterized protein EV420DRAFT_1742751 [Desarmillaria tabescens]|uniref:Uncharacterized protein n=1 Tax=Armillaria tabescens TaxID=1929756 RepID=A0AA39NRR1_ARMTA|nr:uncharacterized protein EV420DRAFT_1742751 [Desarmillaria tabescens]KAK0470404.1 hypothetical protein EV420DRAFT_1742751 [Desarmillaria tabescens]
MKSLSHRFASMHFSTWAGRDPAPGSHEQKGAGEDPTRRSSEDDQMEWMTHYTLRMRNRGMDSYQIFRWPYKREFLPFRLYSKSTTESSAFCPGSRKPKCSARNELFSDHSSQFDIPFSAHGFLLHDQWTPWTYATRRSTYERQSQSYVIRRTPTRTLRAIGCTRVDSQHVSRQRYAPVEKRRFTSTAHISVRDLDESLSQAGGSGRTHSSEDDRLAWMTLRLGFMPECPFAS